MIALVITIGLFATSAGKSIAADTSVTQENENAASAQNDVSNSSSNAEIAREAYDKSDATPTENWFGCPPESTQASAPIDEEDCLPTNNQDVNQDK
jgi:hypothetical protein